MLGKIFRGIISIAGFVGAVFIGIQIEQRMGSEDIAAAEQRGQARGLAEAEANSSSDERQTEFLARLLSIMKSQEAQANIPEAFRNDLTGAIEAAETGEIDRAISLLPEAVELLPVSGCVGNAQPFMSVKGKSFDHCDSKSEIVVTQIYLEEYNGRNVWAMIDGEERRAPLGGRLELKENCYLTVQEVSGTNEDPSVRMRAGCN